MVNGILEKEKTYSTTCSCAHPCDDSEEGLGKGGGHVVIYIIVVTILVCRVRNEC